MDILYRFTFSHPLHVDVVFEQSGPTRCLAKGLAWSKLEAQLRDEPFERDQYWRLVSQEVLSSS